MNEQVLREKVECLIDLARYAKKASLTNSMVKKNFIETLLGAGIWYMPQGIQMWTGFASSKLIGSLLTNEKSRITREHVYSRKKVANYLIESDFVCQADACDVFMDLYLSKVGKFHMVTASENSMLRRFQAHLPFERQEDAYGASGVVLVEIKETDRKRFVAKEKGVLQQYAAV